MLQIGKISFHCYLGYLFSAAYATRKHMGKWTEQIFSNEEIEMTCLAIRQIQVGTTLRLHTIPVRWIISCKYKSSLSMWTIILETSNNKKFKITLLVKAKQKQPRHASFWIDNLWCP